jgi:hypothetical protein
VKRNAADIARRFYPHGEANQRRAELEAEIADAMAALAADLARVSAELGLSVAHSERVSSDLGRVTRERDQAREGLRALYALGHDYLSPEHTAWCKPCRAVAEASHG